MTMQKTAKGFLRGLAAVMAAALAATALSGCQSGEGGGASEPTEVVKVGLLPELELGSRQMTVLSQSSGEDLKELDEDMKELYGLEIEFISVQWASLGEKITQLVLGGTPPDIYYSRMRDFPLLPKKNILQPLDEILDFSLPIYAGTEEVRKDTMYNGQTYASCTQASVPNVMWYNEKLFREAALDTPRQYLERDEWNWNTMLTLAQELTDEAEGRYPLIGDFIEAGVDILNPVQVTAAGMDPAAIKKNYGDRLTFWGGGVDTQHALPFGTPEECRANARAMLDVFAPGGGYVFNSIHNIQAKTPVENILAVFDEARSYRFHH